MSSNETPAPPKPPTYESVNVGPFHVRISDVFGNRRGGDHVAIKPIWYYLLCLNIFYDSIDLATRIWRAVT
jgi:hypothetical protein